MAFLKKLATLLMFAAACAGVAQAKPIFTPLKELVPLELRLSIKAKKRARPSAYQAVDYGPNREKTLSARDSPVKMQFGSTCTTFGLIAAMENLSGGQVDLSERFLWNLYRQYSMTPALNAATKNLLVAESAWPQRQAGRPPRLPRGVLRVKDAPYLGDSVQSVIASIDRGFPVYFASEVLNDFGNCKKTVAPNSRVVPGAGHAYLVVGYRVDSRIAGGGHFLVKNSWGTNCGERGYQWMPFAICTRQDTSCYSWSLRALSAV